MKNFAVLFIGKAKISANRRTVAVNLTFGVFGLGKVEQTEYFLSLAAMPFMAM